MTRRAYFIDSARREITEVGWEAISDLHKMLGGYIETAMQFRNGDVIYVDDEGLLKSQQHFFAVWSMRSDQAFAGHGVLVGREEEGPQFPGGFTVHDPRTSLAEIKRLVSFHSIAEMQLHFARTRGIR